MRLTDEQIEELKRAFNHLRGPIAEMGSRLGLSVPTQTCALLLVAAKVCQIVGLPVEEVVDALRVFYKSSPLEVDAVQLTTKAVGQA